MALPDEHSHAAYVDAWLRRAVRPASPDTLLVSFDLALNALWARTKATLGEVTLTAIVERVLYLSSEEFPFIAAIKVEPANGIMCHDLQEQLAPLPSSQAEQGMRFVLVELLTVLGNLTAEILTPELHAELSRLAVREVSSLEQGRKAPEPTQRQAARIKAHDEET